MANNGLAAVKFIRSIRSWAAQKLGSSKAISLVVMATPDDMKINAEHIQISDQFVEVPGGSNNNNYANVSLIVQVRASRCNRPCVVLVGSRSLLMSGSSGEWGKESTAA